MDKTTIAQIEIDQEAKLVSLEKRAEEEQKKVEELEEEGYDSFSGEKIKLIPSPNFTTCKSVGTLIPVNMASETVSNLSRLAASMDFVEFIKEKLAYNSRLAVANAFSSEQVDALVLAIKQFEKDNAFIIGDQAGIGKGRICSGVLRYAHVNDRIPVFITHKPYLNNDIYRDLRNIGGFGATKFNPLILHEDGVIFERAFDKSTNEFTQYPLFSPLEPKKMLEVCETIIGRASRGNYKLPDKYNCILLPYSTLSTGTKALSVARREMLAAIAPNAIFVFDESHNAASGKINSNILKRTIPLVSACKGVLFSSATYAKTPAVFGLYVVKTALRTAVPSLEVINDALKVGGENVAEYIASGLIAEGQMIRRERGFGDCKKITEFVGKEIESDVTGDILYNQLPEDNQRDIYNTAVGYFKELRDYSKSEEYRAAVITCAARHLAQERVNLADQNQYEALSAQSKVDPEFFTSEASTKFIQDNINKWVIVNYDLDSIRHYKMTFRENLFLAIKARFAADKLVDCLTTEKEYTNLDGTTHIAPLKPLLAIRNTGEAMFSELYLDMDSEIQNDFSTYLKVIYNKLFRGTIVLRKVNNNLFKTKRMLKADEEWRDTWERALDYTVSNEDFADGGAYVNDIQSRLNNYNYSLPFSSIDYLREAVESVERPQMYFNANGTAKYGLAKSKYFSFAEVTSRKYMLKKENGRWYFKKNSKLNDISTAFSNFNNGKSDLLLINQVGSTGGSAQSSPEEGLDTRPRNMFIIQFELDINTEVQKRGRVNRTGQLNSPTYTYIITQIPVELRTYLMFRNKLRKLDANTSADQTASSERSEITDDKGEAIQDIFNEYGFDVFLNGFLNQPNHLLYYAMFDDLRGNSDKLDDAEKVEADISKFIAFTNELELYPTDTQVIRNAEMMPITQEYFFNYMNQAYKEKVELLKSMGEYQLELETKNYKASLRERVVVKLNSGSSVFSSPLFLADYYTLDDKVMYSKDKVESKANALSVNAQGDNIPFDEFHANLIASIDEERTAVLAGFDEDYEKRKPVLKDYPSEESFDKAYGLWTTKKEDSYVKINSEYEILLSYILALTPMKAVSYCGVLGRFIGYKIKETNTKRKYTLSHIEFYFCFLDRYPLIKLRPSNESEAAMLNSIILQTRGTLNQRYEFAKDYLKRVEDWKPDIHKRIIRRLYTGNILGGILEANQQKGKTVDIKKLDVDKNGREFSFNISRRISSWSLVRFSNFDGSKTTGIELIYDLVLPDNIIMDKDNQVLKVSTDNENIKNFINILPNISYIDYNTSAPAWTGKYDKLNDYDLDFRMVIWNNADDNGRYNDRVVCVFKRNDLAVVQIVQPYIIDAKSKNESDYKESSDFYNPIYYDAAMLNMYRGYMTEDKKKILYALKKPEKKDGKSTSLAEELKQANDTLSGRVTEEESTKKGQRYNKVLAAKIKTFVFDFDDVELTSFLNQLYNKYSVSLNFRSSSDEYWMVELQTDTYDKKGKNTVSVEYPEGEYIYRFDDRYVGAENIPNFIRKIDLGLYGGVVLSQPISPTYLRSYNLKPYKIPTDILIKLAFSSLKDDVKTVFSKKVKEYADKSDYDMGEYVMDFLSSKTGTSMNYFFGAKTIPELGKIFKAFALNQELEDFVLEEKQTDNQILKNKVTFADAEDFLMTMLQ